MSHGWAGWAVACAVLVWHCLTLYELRERKLYRPLDEPIVVLPTPVADVQGVGQRRGGVSKSMRPFRARKSFRDERAAFEQFHSQVKDDRTI